MDFSRIQHNAYFMGCYPLDEERLSINIRTGKDVDDVFAYVGDPFKAGISENEDKWSGRKYHMVKIRELEEQYIWTVVAEPEFKRAKYHFELVSKTEHVYMAEDGFYKDFSGFNEGKMIGRFIFPWINPADICRTPEWVQSTIWYQIFPERFNRGDSFPKSNELSEWETRPDNNWREFYGGDIKGITDKLSYISDLGFTGIYLNPILKGRTNHKYDTIDYEMIDPDFGTEEDMKQFVEEAHNHGIKVMLDAVFNHTSSECPMWKDVLEKGPESKFYSWYCVNRWPINTNTHATANGDYYSFAFVDQMPKLNTNNPEVMDYLIAIIKKWIKEWKIDGIRFDVGNEVSHAFLKKMRLAVDEINPDVYLLGEIWNDSFPWLLGDEYHSVMNYPFLTCVNNFWAGKKETAKDFMYGINKCYSMYYEQINRVLFNLLDSHDTDRLFERCEGNADIALQQLAVLLTMQGSPSIYYGTEAMLTGKGSKGNRKCMPWNEIEAGKYNDFSDKLKTLIGIRRDYWQTFNGDISWDACADDRFISYTKAGELRVYINANEEPVKIKHAGRILFSNMYEDGKLMPNGTLIAMR